MKKEYQIKENWKMIKTEESFKQYYSSEILSSNKLLLKSFSRYNKLYRSGCLVDRKYYSNSKIIFIDLNDFNEIFSTNTFDLDVNHIILENLMVIKNTTNVTIYDTNTFQLIPNNTFPIIPNNTFLNSYYNLYSLDNKCAFSIFYYEGKEYLCIYEIKENNIINNTIIESSVLKKVYEINYRDAIYFEKVVFPLRDKKFIIKCWDETYILQLILK